MRRFAAASLWRVLYYEGHTRKVASLGTKEGRRRVGISIDIGIEPKKAVSLGMEKLLKLVRRNVYSKWDLNPHSHHWPKDFKSFVSTDSTIRAT